ncbi:hypothetical protein BV22DRAFT_1108625 [Leucogyrophana mollusca]|uniref:Uncharacterized protein n=1 Tax=Leucogyrophana mollusca TaxID=85980 RepID=A0ACB8AUD2_9AGAM|nr:hypothetical protein BV22DRAFT_1108625 [Leucogyrophana mollusca]
MVIYGLGPYIADYEEQVVLACIVRNWCPKCLALRTDLDGGGLQRCQSHTDALVDGLDLATLWDEYGVIGDLVISLPPFTNDFPQADIHNLLSPDLLHQLIKGTFKDHLVDWVKKYLNVTHGSKRAKEIMSDIDRRIAAVASFSNLRCFPQGRGFKQWTGDDSKALMKVYLPAIEGYVPTNAVRAFHAFLDFCYLVRRNAVKEPWRRSSRNRALGQMLLTNQRIDKLAASRVNFTARGMLEGTKTATFTSPSRSPLDSGQRTTTKKIQLARTYQRKRAQTVAALADEMQVPHLRRLIRWFLFTQLHPDDPRDPEDVPSAICPRHEGKIKVFNSAALMFYAPSDPSGLGGMRREHIRACPLWRNKHARNDCVFVNMSELDGMQGLDIMRVLCFFSFKFRGDVYPCALVHWFNKVDDQADEDTGMWIVRPGFTHDGSRSVAVIHIDCIYRAAHLIPVYGTAPIPDELKYYHSYDAFCSFYVNKYIDHHAYKIAF